MDHIRELRNRVVRIALALIAGMIIGWVFFTPIWRFITKPYCTAIHGCNASMLGHTLAVTGPLDGFYLHIKVAFVAGIILTSPVWLYQIWAFVAPGLYSRERRWTYLFIGTAVPLFLLGSYLALLVMGRGLHFLIGMVPQNAVAIFTADTYISYFMMMILGFGLCFELPLFLVMLNQVGLLPHDRFKKWRRTLIFCVFVFAGVAHAEPGPDHDAAARRGVRRPGGSRRGRRPAQRPARGRPGTPATSTPAWPTTSCPRSTWATPRPATTGSTSACRPPVTARA